MQVETLHYEYHNNIEKQTHVSQKSRLDESIRNIVIKEGYISCDIVKKTIAVDGGSFLAMLYEVDVNGKTADGDKEIGIFVKSKTIEATLEIISLPGVYKTELFVYNEMMKIFNELQNEGNVPADERYNTLKFYEESNDDAIIMENLSRRGFKTWYRMDIVTLDMAKECVKQLAKLHGISFAIEQRKPDFFNKKIKTIQTAYIFGNKWQEFIDKFPKLGIECLDAELRSKIEEKVSVILEKIEDYYTDDSIMCCLCHGDYRPNNIMAKEENGQVTEVIPLDYQLVYYGCPVIDFLYFIYISTDRLFRTSHIVHLKNLYYESLEHFLQYFNISAQDVFPRKLFETLYKEKLDYGLAISLLAFPFLFMCEDEEVMNMTKKEIVGTEFKFDNRIKDRLKDVVEEFIELGYF